jgi:prophage maintenance system killer protein
MCIKMEINKDRIIRINKGLGGNLSRNGSLDYALDMAKHEKRNPYKKVAYIVRAIIVDHPFVDGNKRTALEVVVRELYKENIVCDIKKLTKTIVKIARNNINSIIKIERMLRKCCQKKS